MHIDGHTQLAFLLGYPVSHSASPAMHRAAFAAARVNAAYLPWAVAPGHLPAAVEGLRSMENLLGANVTVPHKAGIVPLLDALTPEAEAIGAVNTVIPRSGRLIGDNTDGAGFLAALQEELGCPPEGVTAVILGAGGAARAVAMGLAQAGADRLVLVNRTATRAEALAEDIRRHHPRCAVTVQTLHPSWRVSQVLEFRLLVNTTSVGLHPGDPLLFDYDSLPVQASVMDLIYRPAETPLLRAARRRGCRALNGLGMLVHQGALAFERWTGKPAPVQAMRDAVGR
jgi:shikimate dehydrogenase